MTAESTPPSDATARAIEKLRWLGWSTIADELEAEQVTLEAAWNDAWRIGYSNGLGHDDDTTNPYRKATS